MFRNMSEASLQSKFAIWLATGIGVGLVSPAPGTIGGLWGLPLAWLVLQLSPWGAQMLVVALIGLAGVAICSVAARALGGGTDPQAIVFDEIAALPIVFLGIEPTSGAVWLVGWLLFRFFDITKPPPIRRFERWPGGWGIMADDWIAAAAACVVLHALLRLDRLAEWGFLTPVA
ncbi:MAG: phosphatidylglycerophosphatase A family protein [Bythopirellula sp.]